MFLLFMEAGKIANASKGLTALLTPFPLNSGRTVLAVWEENIVCE